MKIDSAFRFGFGDSGELEFYITDTDKLIFFCKSNKIVIWELKKEVIKRLAYYEIKDDSSIRDLEIYISDDPYIYLEFPTFTIMIDRSNNEN